MVFYTARADTRDGGYDRHPYGWILWCLAEHYRFTRDDQWLDRAYPGMVAAADWIIRQSARDGAAKRIGTRAPAARTAGRYWRLVDMDIDQLLHVAGFGFRGVGAGADKKS